MLAFSSSFSGISLLGRSGDVRGGRGGRGGRGVGRSDPGGPKRRGRPTPPPPGAPTMMVRGFPNNFGSRGGASGGGGAEGNRIFDELVDFPCVFTFKVIGERQGDFVNDIVDSVADALHTDRKNLKTSYRDRGKYRSITLRAPVNTGEQIYTVYAAISRDPRVKFKF